jgi:hypothetical protein
MSRRLELVGWANVFTDSPMLASTSDLSLLYLVIECTCGFRVLQQTTKLAATNRSPSHLHLYP